MIRVHVVPHTHWDREWYHPAARFQTRLVRLIDGVLDQLAAEGGLASFLLDGQSILLDDYLAARPAPARLDALRAMLAAGRIESGPFYTLPDELLVSAESLIRNLIQGGQAVRRAGGQPMRVGYSPDAFGHSGAMPTILRGFDIDVAVVWRGFGGEGDDSDLHRWRSADGSEVLMIHLPRPGYEYGSGLPRDHAGARARWHTLAMMLAPRSRADVWLVLAGADHHAPPPHLLESVAALREAAWADAPGVELTIGTLGAYAGAATSASESLDLPVVTGELRGGRAHAWSLQGTHSARLVLKRWNAHCQRLLERAAEPLAALAAARTGADLRAELGLAWRALLENHPHDSICGTSADEVHREMLTRFARCRTHALETIHHGLHLAIGHDAARAREAGRDAWTPGVVVFNPSARPATGVVEAEIAVFVADVPVGPGSGKRGRSGGQLRRSGGQAVGRSVWGLRDAAGQEVPFQALERWTGYDLTESPEHYPDCDLVEWVRAVMWVNELPPLGVVTVALTTDVPKLTAGPPARLTALSSLLENEHLIVRAHDDGSIELIEKESGEHYHGIGALDDVRDEGDSYTSSRRGAPRILEPDFVASRLVAEGPLRAVLEIERRYAEDLVLTMRVTLDAGARALALAMVGYNGRPGRRLRFRAPAGVREGREVADAHFGTVARRTVDAAPVPDEQEAHAGTAPMQRFVRLARAERGLAVFADGLPEYAVDAAGTIAVTLLRGFGELSKRDLPERPGHAGWPTATPEAQCLGRFEARIAVMPGTEAQLADGDLLEAAADRFHAPPLARMVRALTLRAAPVPGPRLVGSGFCFSAMKPAEDGRGIVLRCYNGSGFEVRGAWEIPWPVSSATQCRLDETDVADVEVNAGCVPLLLGPHEVVSIRIV